MTASSNFTHLFPEWSSFGGRLWNLKEVDLAGKSGTPTLVSGLLCSTSATHSHPYAFSITVD